MYDEALAPVRLMPVIGKGVVPPLRTCTLLTALALLTICTPRLSDVGVSCITAPIPLRATVGGLPTVLAVMVIRPLRSPAAAGVKTTETVQLAPMASVAGEIGQFVVRVKLP